MLAINGMIRNRRPNGLWNLVLLAGLLGGAPGPLPAGDWPQILGPHRNGIAVGEQIAASWPAKGPRVTWQRDVGPGYAGVAVVGETGYLFHRIKSEEVVEAFEAATGNPLWKQAYPTTFYPSVGGSNGEGPLCVPTVVEGRVITFGAQGVLSAFDAKKGDPLWRRDTHADFSALEGYFGAGSAPLVVEKTVIVNVGGREESGLVGFDLQTGQTLWTKSTEQGSYAAPVSTEVDGIPMVVAVTRLKCIALSPSTGAIFWQFPFGQRGPTVNGACPLILKNHLFLTASYGVGAGYWQFGITDIKPVWKKDGVLSSQYTTPIEYEGRLYGIHGRDDVPPADLVCIDPTTGKRLWSEQDFGYATLVRSEARMIAVKSDGTLVLIDLNPEGYRQLAQANVFKSTVRALPALSGGGLFLRDEKTLKRFDLANP